MLTSRARYATRAILDLSLMYEAGPVSIQDIAERQNIPVKFLQQILGSLKMTGFVQSRKGPGGGFTLSMPPSEITLGAVVRAMDGPIAQVSCVSVTRFGDCGCPNPEICSLRSAFKQARDAISDVLDNTTFEVLTKNQLAAIDAPASQTDDEPIVGIS